MTMEFFLKGPKIITLKIKKNKTLSPALLLKNFISEFMLSEIQSDWMKVKLHIAINHSTSLAYYLPFLGTFRTCDECNVLNLIVLYLKLFITLAYIEHSTEITSKQARRLDGCKIKYWTNKKKKKLQKSCIHGDDFPKSLATGIQSQTCKKCGLKFSIKKAQTSQKLWNIKFKVKHLKTKHFYETTFP